ncbi:MAG: SCO family protein [Steroidobacteraceae bacterium]
MPANPPQRSVARRLFRASAGALLALATLAACTPPQAPFGLQNVTGLLPPLRFNLTNQDGRPVSAEDFRSKVVLLYFGYTNCPDVCPMTLALLNHAVESLGSRAAQVRVLFVSVDPARDTAAVLKRYVSAFAPYVVGLRGDDDALDALVRRYRVTYHRESPDAHGYYAVDHSSAVFIFDREGNARLLAEESSPPKVISADLRRLIAP